MTDTHITTPVEVERNIVRLCEILDLAISEIKKRAIAAAEAEAEYRKVHAQAILQSEGTIPEREAQAALATSDLYRDRKIAEALLASAQSASRLYQSQLDGFRSLNTNVRAQAGLSS